MSPIAPELAVLMLGDPPSRWEALGFAVRDGHVQLGGVEVTLGGTGRGISRWAIRGIEATQDIDGLPLAPAPPLREEPATHPNGATAIDHVVVVTPDFDRTAARLEDAGLPLRRIRDAGGYRQGFRRLAGPILELVEARGGAGVGVGAGAGAGAGAGVGVGAGANTVPPGPARFWGLVVIVEDLAALAGRLTDRLGEIKPAVQAGRHIATLRSHAELGQKLAFMDPEP